MSILKYASVLLILLLFGAAFSRPRFSAVAQDSTVYVTSWKKGNGRIARQELTLSLQNAVSQYELNAFTPDKKRHFRLSLRQSLEKTPRNPGLPCWVADFREVTRDRISRVNLLGYSLLSVEGPGVGHYFPREEWAPFFCPVEKPNRVLDGLFYPMKAERRFFVESFILVLKVTDYQLDEQQNKLTKLELTVELKNE